jgi:hypothetical protein
MATGHELLTQESVERASAAFKRRWEAMTDEERAVEIAEARAKWEKFGKNLLAIIEAARDPNP